MPARKGYGETKVGKSMDRAMARRKKKKKKK
jgi:hypothetical protein